MKNRDKYFLESQLLRLIAATTTLFAFTKIEPIVKYLARLFETLQGVGEFEIILLDFFSKPQQFINSKLLGVIPLINGKFTQKNFDKLYQYCMDHEILFYPVRIIDEFYGFFALKIVDQQKYSVFDPVINNLSITTSTIIENIIQKKAILNKNAELEKHKDHLSELVKEKTLALSSAMIELKKSLVKTIQVIAATAEQHDPYTAGHQYRVAILSEAIALKLGLSSSDVREVYLGALIHDIGKVQVPAALLTTPAKLSTIEFEIIKTHPEAGYAIAQQVPFSKTISDIILHHHERLDGSGYPNGLSADEIPLSTRIVSIADVFEAMSSHRPYRPGHSIEATINELVHGVGRHYDSNAVAACVQLITKEGFTLPKQPIL